MTTNVESARAEVLDARSVLADLEASKAAAEAAIEELQGRAVTAAPATPDGVRELAQAIQLERDHVAIAESAIAVQEQTVAAVERAYLAAEADLLEKPVAAAQGRLEKHEARTRALHAELAKHEGKYVPEKGTGRRSVGLRRAVAAAERELELVRTMAAGGDPADLLVQWGLSPVDAGSYPATIWGPTALVPAPRYREQVDQVRAQLEDLDKEIGQVEARRHEAQTELEERKAIEARGDQVPADLGGKAELEELIKALDARVAELEGYRGPVVAELAELTGETAPAAPAPAGDQPVEPAA